MNNTSHLPSQKSKSKFSLIADDLLQNNQIGTIRLNTGNVTTSVVLNTNDIFSSLVTSYSSIFCMQWSYFNRLFGGSPPKEQEDDKTDVRPWTLASRIYISCWIHDLYVSIRHSVRKCPYSSECYQHFEHQELVYSDSYDYFLTQLTSSIRPTRLVGTPLDTLYFPLLSSNTNINWNSSNPFNIPGYKADFTYLHGLLDIIRNRKIWVLCENHEISNFKSNGRPFWLFDSHKKCDECYAWFPMEGNYSVDDVALAFCVGVACSPNMGFCDFDDWQVIPDDALPYDVNACNRVRSRSLFGNVDVRTLNRRKRCIIKKTEEECYVRDEVDEIQIIDWCYHRLHYQKSPEPLPSLIRNFICNQNFTSF